MEKFESIMKIVDVVIKFIALVFPIVLFRKQILHFSNLINTDISIDDTRNKYFLKGAVNIRCEKGKLINPCLSLLLIEGRKCVPIIFEKINGLSYLYLKDINEKSFIRIELSDTNIYNLLNEKLTCEKDKYYLLVLVTYSQKYDQNVFVKEKYYTIHDPGEYILTDEEKKENDTVLSGRDISLPFDMINDKKLKRNIDVNIALQNKIIYEITTSYPLISNSNVCIANCIPRVIYKYFDEKDRKLKRKIK